MMLEIDNEMSVFCVQSESIQEHHVPLEQCYVAPPSLASSATPEFQLDIPDDDAQEEQQDHAEADEDFDRDPGVRKEAHASASVSTVRK